MSENKQKYQSEFNSWMKYIREKYCQDMIKLHGDDEGMKKYLDFKNSLIQLANEKK